MHIYYISFIFNPWGSTHAYYLIWLLETAMNTNVQISLFVYSLSFHFLGYFAGGDMAGSYRNCAFDFLPES